jgi:hypothetical protein
VYGRNTIEHAHNARAGQGMVDFDGVILARQLIDQR